MAGRHSTWGGMFNPHLIEDDDESNDTGTRFWKLKQETQTGRQLAEWAASFNTRTARDDERSSPSSVSDFDREERIEAALEQDIADVIDLTGDDDDDASPILSETHALRQAEHHVTSYRLPNGEKVQAGVTVELRNAHGPYGIKFLRVQSVIRAGWDSEVLLRGLGFTRTRELDGMLPPKLNEVAMVAELRSWTRSQWQEQALVDVEARNILRVRDLRVTNAPFPEHRFDSTEFADMGKDWVENYSPLVCRFRFDVRYHGACEKPCEWALVKIGEDDADSGYKILDKQNLNRWRGGKVPGGSHKPGGVSHPVVDLDSGPSSGARPSTLSPGQRYTAGDVFAGAGGASRGIERAGVKLLFAVDHWDPAVQSLRSNFPRSEIYNMDVYDFITSDETRRDVDILHLSPPCQFWSPAHTVPGQNDEQNQAVLFCCTDLIYKFRPRLFTVEQTFGILSPKFREFFHTFLNGFTVHGYSVRWKILPLSNYGVPQLRKRLIMIGSAPGERLPPFPPATHAKDGAGGLKSWATPFSVLAPIAPTLPNRLHRPHLRRRFDPPKTPWDPTRLARTITCSGGQNYHWSGERDFTLLEYAVLQGFPTWHRFEGQYVKKQIGNAFAPSVVKILYEHLVEWLLKEDGFEVSGGRAGRAEMPVGLAPGDLMDLVDSGDGVEVEEEVIEVGSRSLSEGRREEPVRRAVVPRGLSLPQGAVYVGLDGDDDVQMQEAIYADLHRTGESVREFDRAVRNVDVRANDGFGGSHRNSSRHIEGVVSGGLAQRREDVRRVDRTASYVEAQAAGYSQYGNNHEQTEGVHDLRSGFPRSENGMVWELSRVARKEDVYMQDVEDLSDTETLRDGEVGLRGGDEFKGTPHNPVVLSDEE